MNSQSVVVAASEPGVMYYFPSCIVEQQFWRRWEVSEHDCTAWLDAGAKLNERNIVYYYIGTRGAFLGAITTYSVLAFVHGNSDCVCVCAKLTN